jgi:hypothetical protein
MRIWLRVKQCYVFETFGDDEDDDALEGDDDMIVDVTVGVLRGRAIPIIQSPLSYVDARHSSKSRAFLRVCSAFNFATKS